MEFGEHCNFCKKIDFLPFLCKTCNKNFCSDHINSHKCVKKINVKKNKINVKKNYETCHMKNCKKNIIHYCKLCNNSFCVEHRLQEIHNCKNKDILNNAKNILTKDNNKTLEDNNSKENYYSDEKRTKCSCIIC